MMSPFDQKNRLATALDALALRALLLAGCVLYFYLLWRRGLPSLLAGGALFFLLLLSLTLLERRTLVHRDRLLRERIGGMIALDEMMLLPQAQACDAVCALLCGTLGASPLDGGRMLYEGETWLVRCAQCLRGARAGEGDVLAAHRARVESGAGRCVLASTGGFTPGAVRASEWVDPPVRLIAGRQLALLAGKLHPATDEEIARHARRQRVPFSWRRIRALALSPSKLPRYLLCAFLLLLFYFLYGSPVLLFSCLLSYVLALLCDRENRRLFRL